jgi:hypothetical protein
VGVEGSEISETRQVIPSLHYVTGPLSTGVACSSAGISGESAGSREMISAHLK